MTTKMLLAVLVGTAGFAAGARHSSDPMGPAVLGLSQPVGAVGLFDELDCGLADPDDPNSVDTYQTSLSSAETAHDLDLPTWLPAGYELSSTVEVEEDEQDGSVFVYVPVMATSYSGNPWHATLIFSNDEATSGVSLPGLNQNELGWQLGTGAWRMIDIHNTSAMALSNLELIACSMASYTGSC